MNRAELDVLEQDVANARRRLANDLTKLRSPDTLSSFKNDLWARAQETKEELVHKASESASNGAHRILADLKARAAANPVATLAIGAGLAWRLAHHPPIATLLVGVGLASLFRTGTNHHGRSDMLSHASKLAGTVGDKVQKWGEEARDVTQQAVSHVASTASNLGAQVSNMASTASQLGAHASNMASTASNVGAQAKQLADRTFAHPGVRDNYLLGAAALAVGAATIISYQRRNSDLLRG